MTPKGAWLNGGGGDFAAVTHTLMEARGLSHRSLSALTERIGHRYSPAYLGLLLRREQKATPENMEVVAEALGVEPTVFREYRQHLAAEAAAKLAGEIELDVVLDALRRLSER